MNRHRFCEGQRVMTPYGEARIVELREIGAGCSYLVTYSKNVYGGAHPRTFGNYDAEYLEHQLEELS